MEQTLHSRKFENEILEFFVSKIPSIKEFTKNTFDMYEESESIGSYILIPDIIRYFTEQVTKKNERKIKEFLKIFEEFYKKYSLLNKNEITELVFVEFYETLSSYDYLSEEFVVNLLNPKMQMEYKNLLATGVKVWENYTIGLLKEKGIDCKLEEINPKDYKILDTTNGKQEIKPIEIEDVTHLFKMTNNNKNIFAFRQIKDGVYFGVIEEDSSILLLEKDKLVMFLMKRLEF